MVKSATSAPSCPNRSVWAPPARPDRRGSIPLAALTVALLLTGCEREQRDLRLDPPVASALDEVATMANGIGGAPPQVYTALEKPFVWNAYDLSQGKRLYHWFGCRGCHGDGRGGIGPPLLDGWWQYGPDGVSIYVSIRDGRPHGMPSFRDKLTNEQIWQLAGYVHVLGAYTARTAAPSRNDGVDTRPAENRAPAAIMFNQFPEIR